MEKKSKIKHLGRDIKSLDDFHVGDVIQVGPDGSHRLELITGRDVYQMKTVYRESPKEIVWGVRAIEILGDCSLSPIRVYEMVKRDSGDLAQQKIYQALDQLLNEYGIKE